MTPLIQLISAVSLSCQGLGLPFGTRQTLQDGFDSHLEPIAFDIHRVVADLKNASSFRVSVLAKNMGQSLKIHLANKKHEAYQDCNIKVTRGGGRTTTYRSPIVINLKHKLTVQYFASSIYSPVIWLNLFFFKNIGTMSYNLTTSHANLKRWNRLR